MPITTIEEALVEVARARDGALKLRDNYKDGSARWDMHNGTYGNYCFALSIFAEGIRALREKQEASTLSLSDFPSDTFLSDITKGL